MKQFLRNIFLLLALFMATASAWAADCTYTKNLNGSSHESKDFNHTICFTTSEAPNVAISITYTIKLTSTFLGKGLTYTLYAIDSSGQQYQIASGLKVDNGKTKTETQTFTFDKDITSYKIDQTSDKFGGNRELTISDVTVTYKYAPSLTTGKSHFTIDDTPVGASSSVSFSVDYQNSTNTVTMVANESSDVNNSFSISPSSKTLTDCSGTIDYTVTFSPQSEMENATATYVISGSGSSLTVNVTATSFATVNPEYTCNIADSYMVDAPAIDLNTLWVSTSPAQKNYNIVSWTPSGSNNTNAVHPAIKNNFLSLGQAGILVLSLSQAETTGYYADSDTKTITINKYGVDAFISQSSALRNEIIDNPFSLSDGLINFDVESKNTNIAEYHKDTKKIQTYFTDGTASFQITRPEDYKYNALSKILTLDVSQSTVNCLVLEDADQRDWETINNSGTYTIPSGTPESLFFQARRTDILGFTNTTEFYAEYSSDNNTWTEAMKINLPDQGTWYDLKCDIPETAKYVRFITYTGATGNKHIRNVCVTRKTYLRPSVSSLALPQATIGKPVSASFNLDWSTCSDEIVLLSTNTNFVLSKSSIDATSRCGTATITVTYDANSGSQSGTIIIYDQSQKIEIPVSCEVKSKLATEIIYTGELQYGEIADGIPYPFYVKDENGNTVTGATITLATSNEDILSFDADKIYPHCGGNVTLTANYGGDATHEPATDLSIEIKVENCMPIITWNQNLKNFVTDDNGIINETRVLEANVNPSGLEVYYELDEKAQQFAEIIENDGIYSVRVFAIGRGKIYAYVNGGEYDDRQYDGTYVMHEIRSRRPGACDSYSLYIDEEQNTHGWGQNYMIYELSGLPESTMTFGSHVEYGSVNNTLYVDFSSDGANWGERTEFSIGRNYKWDYQCAVPEGSKYVRFETVSSFRTYINMIIIAQQNYLQASVDEIRVEDAIVNEPFSRTFTVEYSDVPLIQYSVTDTHDLGLELTPTPAVENDCGEYGSYEFVLTGESPYPQDVTEMITIFTSAGDRIEIPVIIKATLSEPFYFNVQDGDMAVSSNWTYNGSNTHGLLPDKRFPIIVSQAMTINEGELVAYGVTIENGGSVNIQPKGGLTLHAGGFTDVTENNFEVQNNLEGAGFVRVSQYFKKLGGTMPKMKVHFTTKANMNNGENKDAAWQYIGAPGAETQMQVVNTSTLYLRSEEKGWVRQWDSNASLTPFAGYAFTQKDQPSIDFTPRLVTDNQIITLTYTEGGMKGDNLWANSYMAPIDIKKLGKEDFSGTVDQIVYLYNCGSWNEWNKDQSAIKTAEEQPGRYYAIPVGSARALDATYDQTVIPPMQGVYMVANSGGGSLTLNYEKHVWNCESNEMNRALRIAGKRTAEEDYLSSILRIRLQINSQNSGADRMYLIQDSTCTADYDNGFDAPKQMTEGLLNLYTNEACGQMEISATDNIDGIYLGFAAGEDEVYTMTFTSLIGEDLYLYDVEQDTLVGMANGDTYEFAAAARSTNDMRFQILVNPDLGDDQPNTGNDGNVTTNLNSAPMQQLWVHDKNVYISHASANSVLEVYTVSGVPVTRYAIGYAPCVLDLSDITTGVYMLRLNDQVYKFVCK